jgi:hypothetical protein
MYGKNHTDEAKRKISKANKGEKNGVWKGDDVGNNALHGWVRRNKPKPDLCESCKEKPPRDLHNTPGTYKRNLEDWVWLCRRCHMTEDKRLIGLIERNKDGTGKSPSEETRKKLSEASKGKPKSKLCRLHMKEGWIKRRMKKLEFAKIAER